MSLNKCDLQMWQYFKKFAAKNSLRLSKYCDSIIGRIYEMGGHCPNQFPVSAATTCPCEKMRNERICKCKLFFEEKESNNV